MSEICTYVEVVILNWLHRRLSTSCAQVLKMIPQATVLEHSLKAVPISTPSVKLCMKSPMQMPTSTEELIWAPSVSSWFPLSDWLSCREDLDDVLVASSMS